MKWKTLTNCCMCKWASDDTAKKHYPISVKKMNAGDQKKGADGTRDYNFFGVGFWNSRFRDQEYRTGEPELYIVEPVQPNLIIMDSDLMQSRTVRGQELVPVGSNQNSATLRR